MEDKQRFPFRRWNPDNFRHREDPKHEGFVPFGGNFSTQQQRQASHTTSRSDNSTQERLEFDKNTGKLVLSADPQELQTTSVPNGPENALVVAGVRSKVVDRPVVDAMAAQGFFIFKMTNFV